MKKHKNYGTVSSILLRADILAEARTIGIPDGFAITIAESVAKNIEDYIETHPIVTPLDIKSLVSSELSQFSPDLAYIYHNRDTII